MTNLVFISSRIKSEKLEKFRLTQEGEVTFVLVDSDDISKYQEYSVLTIKSYRKQVNDRHNYWQIAMDWTDNWNRQTGFYKKVMYQGFSLWWFQRLSFHRWLQSTLADIDAVRELLAEVDKAGLFLLEADSYWRDMVQTVATSQGRPVVVIDRRAKLAVWIDRLRLVQKVPLLAVKWLRAVQGALRLVRKALEKRARNRPRVLIFTLSMNWQNMCNEDGQMWYYDTQLGQVLELLRASKKSVVALDMMSQLENGWLTLWFKRWPYIPIEGYAALFIRAMLKARQHLKNLAGLSELEKSFSLESANLYSGINIGNIIKRRLTPFITRGCYMWIVWIEFYRLIIAREKPDVIVVTDDYVLGRPLVTAARISGVPSLAVQHGLIHQKHLGYVYPSDVERESIPLPDKMAVFGEFDFEILTRLSIYKGFEVMVTGQSRLDLLNREAPDSESIKLPRDKKILLFTSQPLTAVLSAEILMNEFSQLGEDYLLIIKLHPAETYPCQHYQEAAERYKVKNFAIVQQTDLYQLLRLCDIHLSVFSTVLSEAVIFNKPNLILSLPGFSDLGGWVEQGVALNLNDFSSLKEAVETILFDDETRQRLQKQRDEYVKRRYFSLDGKSTERIYNLVLSLGGDASQSLQ
jgi:glycosyltransferase involved in cell wall biosynthesis